MVKSTKSWPRPAAPKPAELPSGIFYAVVTYNSNENNCKPKKESSRCRNDFDYYIHVIENSDDDGSTNREGKFKWESSDSPTLFTTLAEAQELKTIVALHYEDTESIQVFIQTFRLIESNWRSGADNWTTRRRDALDMAEGNMSYDHASEQVKKLAGKVLTILDAAYVNENQNKAVKDLVKQSFRSQLSDMWKDAYANLNSGECSEGDSWQKDILD